MKNIYLAVVILIAVLVIAGGAVIFLMNRSSQSTTGEVPVLEPAGAGGIKLEPVLVSPQQSTGASEVEQPSEATAAP